MPDEKNGPSGFKVVDKRLFSEDGSPRSSEPDRKPVPETAPVASGPATPPDETSTGDYSEEAPSGFAMLVSYLSTTAMFQMGLLAGPSGERIPSDLANARMTIDLIEVLKEKTEGNLTDNEARMLEDVLYELRMSFMEVQKRSARPAK